MSIAWNLFTPGPALAGGVLIGSAAALLWLLNGRIAGISGILGGLLKPVSGAVGWRLALLAGLVFEPGLIVSGMTNPAKVLAFLDLAGAWDPSLALVMAGAIGIGGPAFFATRRRTLSLLGVETTLPAARRIDRRLLAGSALFGIGWGVAGFCSGPGLVALGTGQAKALVFVVAMLAGMGLFEWFQWPRRR